jgi:hypothetical protein
VTMVQRTVQNSINGLSCAALALTIVVSGIAAPAEALEQYHSAVATQQQNRFSQNAIKSFVYHVFALYDKHEDVSKFLPLLSDDGLEMRFPKLPFARKRISRNGMRASVTTFSPTRINWRSLTRRFLETGNTKWT